MIKSRYFAQKDGKTASPCWQVGCNDPKNNFTFKPLVGYYSKRDARDLAEKLNHAIDEFIAINEMPNSDNKLLAPKIIDPNDLLESEKRLSALAIWMSNTERLEAAWSGSVINKILELRNMLLNALQHFDHKVKKDSAGNWHIRK
jgi:hypothetical protein